MLLSVDILCTPAGIHLFLSLYTFPSLEQQTLRFLYNVPRSHPLFPLGDYHGDPTRLASK